MRNLSPLLLTLILAATALFLTLRGDKKTAAKSLVSNSKETQTQVPATAEVSNTTTANPADSQSNERTWPHEKSDIPVDPTALFGTLENGMRYMIMPNSEPPNRLSLRLHVAAGSLMEDNDQRGLAHFLEHMVFNGTKSHKDANALIREMQTRGIAFGAHVNAYTSFDETVYMLDLPDLKPDTMKLTFSVMRDFADGALLSAEEIDAERGVILAEKASRDSVEYRMMQKQFRSLLPGSLIGERFPIGEEEVIKNAPRERFLDFYQKYYTPDRMTFVAVGNIDPAELELTIKEIFGTLENPENPGNEPNMGELAIPEGLKPHIFSDPELASTDVSLNLVRPFEKKPDTKETRAARFPVEIAHAIMDRRFERITKQENSPVSAGSASKFVLFNKLEMGSVSLTAADDRWQEVVPVLENELRRAKEHGFTDAEFSEAKANLLNAYREAVKRKDSRKSESLATAIARSVNDGSVYSTPEGDLELAEEILNSISVEDVLADFVKFWEAPGYHLVLSTKEAPEGSEETLAAIYEKSAKTVVEPPAARTLIPFGYIDLGKPGTVASMVEIKDFNITQIKLANNVRINLKKTDFEKNLIRTYARIGVGQLSQPKGTPMLDKFASAIFQGGGLGKHSNDELAEILAGRNVSAELSIGEDVLSLSGSTTPKDQLLQLQVMIALLTDPGYRPDALWQFQKEIPMLFQTLKHTTSGPMMEMNSWLHGGDFRYSVPTQVQISNYTIDQVKEWLEPELENSYLELTIVGDFDRETLLKDLLATFGTLAKRDAAPAANAKLSRKISFPKPPIEKTFSYESKIPQAAATAIWKTDGMRDNILEVRRLNILSDIYGDRLREEIREKLGASYSPNAGVGGSDALESVGYLIGQSIGKPDDIPLLLTTMEKIATDLSEKGATQQELDRALAPTLTDLEKTLRDNSYWLTTVLSQSQADPEKLELARSRDKDYRSITLKEINALAKKYYTSKNLHKISILPKEK